MRYPVLVAAMAAAALAGTGVSAAAPAHDKVFPRSEVSSLTLHAGGQPFWALLAECAGVYGAASNWESERGHADAAEEDARIGTHMANEAIQRLMEDRGLSHDDALAYAGVEINTGRAQGQDFLARGDHSAYSLWNTKRSACLEIDEIYAKYRYR